MICELTTPILNLKSRSTESVTPSFLYTHPTIWRKHILSIGSYINRTASDETSRTTFDGSGIHSRQIEHKKALKLRLLASVSIPII